MPHMHLSTIHNSQSTIYNLQSTIYNLQSTIHNQPSTLQRAFPARSNSPSPDTPKEDQSGGIPIYLPLSHVLMGEGQGGGFLIPNKLCMLSDECRICIYQQSTIYNQHSTFNIQQSTLQIASPARPPHPSLPHRDDPHYHQQFDKSKCRYLFRRLHMHAPENDEAGQNNLGPKRKNAQCDTKNQSDTIMAPHQPFVKSQKKSLKKKRPQEVRCRNSQLAAPRE